MSTVVYRPSTLSDRHKETLRVIATVRATIAPAEQAHALRDLKRGADGEPQLDEELLEREARIAGVKLEGHTDEDMVRLRQAIADPQPADWAGLAYSAGVLLARVAELEEQLAEAPRCEIGTELLVEAENGTQRAGGRYTLLVRVERFEQSGVWVRRHFDKGYERLRAPFRIVPPRGEREALRAKVERLQGIEVRAAKHAVACATVIAALMRRLGIDEATIEGEELAAIDHAIDIDVERGAQGDYERLHVRAEPRTHEDG